MRTDTMELLPELKESKDSVQSLIDMRRAKDQIEVIELQKQRANTLLSSVSEHHDVLLERFEEAGYTDVASLSEEQIEEIYAGEESLSINIPFKDDLLRKEAKRDFLEMVINSARSIEKIDGELERLNTIYEEYEDETRQIFDEFSGDITEFARTKLEEVLASAKESGDEAIQQATQLSLQTLDDSLTLDSLVDTYSKLNPRNTLGDFLHRGVEITHKFIANTKRNGIAVDFSTLDHLEALALPREYATHRNLFIFLVVKKYAMKKEWNRQDCIFITQLLLNLQVVVFEPLKPNYVMTETMQAKRDKMINGIKRVLDPFKDL